MERLNATQTSADALYKSFYNERVTWHRLLRRFHLARPDDTAHNRSRHEDRPIVKVDVALLHPISSRWGLPVVGSGRMAAKLFMPIFIVALLQNLQRVFLIGASSLGESQKTKTYTSSIQRHNPRPCLVAKPASKTNRRKNGRRLWIPKDDGSHSSTPQPTADSRHSA